ncbi:MAG: SRPBCC family protein [Acidobacteria bacterium]|nr:SRPBCC family protein [Acidobacteriota bacterium]
MDLSEYQHSETVTIARPAEELYDLVADVSRMGEWSPVNTGGEWEDGEHSWFRGRNQVGDRVWETRCRIDVAEPGKSFAFTNCGAAGAVDMAQWGYTFTPVADGTEVTEWWRLLPSYEGEMLRRDPNSDIPEIFKARLVAAQTGIAETLANLKRAAEATR